MRKDHCLLSWQAKYDESQKRTALSRALKRPKPPSRLPGEGGSTLIFGRATDFLHCGGNAHILSNEIGIPKLACMTRDTTGSDVGAQHGVLFFVLSRITVRWRATAHARRKC